MAGTFFEGVCPALVTPFHERGGIDFESFGRLIDFQISAGVDAVCVGGTTGEASTLTISEHRAAVEFCVRQVNHRVKVIAGCGSNNTGTAVQLSRQAQSAGADALLHVTPYYNKPTQSGLIAHYESIADSVDLPVILYNVPGRTGVTLTASSYRRLSDHPNIIGTKEASGNLALITETLSLCGSEFTVWSGNDDQAVPMMALGAKGVISVACNLIPEVMVDMTHLCLNHNFGAAAALQIAYSQLFCALFIETNPIPVKTAMNLLGMNMGVFRLPLCEMSSSNLSSLKQALANYGLL